MFFPGLEHLVDKHPDLGVVLGKLDHHFAEAGKKPLIEANDAALFIDEPVSVVESALDLLKSEGFLQEWQMYVCESCENRIRKSDVDLAKQQGDEYSCDGCGDELTARQLVEIVAYTPNPASVLSPRQLRRQDCDVEGLHLISEVLPASHIADVVFVHGLDGDWKTTWHPKNNPGEFWPTWLDEDLPDVAVWSVDYDVASLAWKGSAMPLTDRATNVLAKLDSVQVGERPLIFLTHSLGGLLTKQMLRHAHSYGDDHWRAVLTHIRGVVFLSTPHSGSSIANWIKYAALVLRPNVVIDELQAHDSRLRDLNIWYRNNVDKMGINTQVYYEAKPTRGVIVVDPSSADPGIKGVTPVPLDEDHISICKPTSRRSLVYVRTLKFIQCCFALT